MNVILVLGCGITELGYLSSEAVTRLETALELWKADAGRSTIVVSEGAIADGISAADQMALWLEDRGVWGILKESAAADTYENLTLSWKLWEWNRLLPDFITVVSEAHHLDRFAITARAYGVSVVKAPAKVEIGLLRWVVERLFLWYTLYDPKGEKWLARLNRKRRHQKWHKENTVLE